MSCWGWYLNVFFSFNLKYFWVLVWWMMFDWNLNIFSIIRLWILFKLTVQQASSYTALKGGNGHLFIARWGWKSRSSTQPLLTAGCFSVSAPIGIFGSLAFWVCGLRCMRPKENAVSSPLCHSSGPVVSNWSSSFSPSFSLFMFISYTMSRVFICT